MNNRRFFNLSLAWIGGFMLIMMAVLMLQVRGVTSQEAGDDLREADRARAAEEEGLVESEAIVNPNLDRGGVFPLFMGVDDTAIPAYLMDPATNISVTAFLGTNVWSAAYDPVNDRVLFTNGVTLHEWPVGGAVNTLGAVNNGAGNNLSIVGMAFYDGTLYGYTASVTEGIWIIDPNTQVATLHIATVAADTDCGGLAADPSDGTFYCTSDDTTGPGGAGLYIVNGDGSLTFVTAYPAGETDVDGLTVGTDGRAYLITDDDTPKEVYVYDLVGGSYLPSLVNPWPVGDQLFSAGAWIEQQASGPGISLEKTVGLDQNICAATNTISVTQGTQVTYCYEVTNTGTFTLYNHDLVDSETGIILNGFFFGLGPGASAFVTDTDTIFNDTTNVATWTACNQIINQPGEGGFNCASPNATNIVSDTAEATVFILPPSIELAKTVGTDPNVCAGTTSIIVDPGTDVTYCYEVTNTGPYTLTVHDLDDSELGTILTGFPFDLDPGASVFVTQTANIVTDTMNTAVWTACNIDGPPSNTCFGPATFDVISDTASANVMVNLAAPDITVDPAILVEMLMTDMQNTQVLTIGNVGDANLLWTIDEETAVTAPTAPPAPLAPPTAGPVVESPADCVLYENYAGEEPEGYAEYCGGGVLEPWTSEQFDPTDTGYALDLRFDGFVSHVLNDFAGQTVLGTNAQSIFAMDFDETGTILYALDNTSRELGTLNLATGAFTPIAVVSGIPAADTMSGLTIDPSNGTAYVSGLTTGVQMTLYTLNLSTAVATPIGSDASVPLLIDIAIGPQGIMYGHDIGTDMIYTINTATGAATSVGLTGVNSNFAQGMDFDNADGTLYAYTYQGTGANQYGTIDLATGALTPLSIDNPLGEFEGATQTAIGGCAPSDLPWLSLSPTSGTTAPAGIDTVDVTFDSTGLAPNVYLGTLCVASNDPDEPVVRVPVELTVIETPPAPGLVLTKTVGTDNSVCAATDSINVTTGADVYYCYTIQNTGDITFTTHDLVDDQLGTLLTGFAQDVGPGEVFSYYPVTATITGSVTNVADWTAYVDTALFVTATDSAAVTAGDPTDVSLNSFTGNSNTAALPIMVGLLAVLVFGAGFLLRRSRPFSSKG